nr:hypothetical protein CFP56_71889 [Quercus suber]
MVMTELYIARKSEDLRISKDRRSGTVSSRCVVADQYGLVEADLEYPSGAPSALQASSSTEDSIMGPGMQASKIDDRTMQLLRLQTQELTTACWSAAPNDESETRRNLRERAIIPADLSCANDSSPGSSKRSYEETCEDTPWVHRAQILEQGGIDPSAEHKPPKSIRHSSDASVRDGHVRAAIYSGIRRTAGLTTEISRSSDEDLFIQPGAETLAQVEHLTQELRDIKSLLPFLVATSTQRKAVLKLVERFLPKQSAPYTAPLPTVATSASTTSIGSHSTSISDFANSYQSKNSRRGSIVIDSSPQLAPSQPPQISTESTAALCVGNNAQELQQEKFAGRRRAYIEVFGNSDSCAGISGNRQSRYVNMQIQQYLVSSLWLLDHEILDPEERRVNSAFYRMRDRSRAQIMLGVPPEAVFGLPYPALLFASGGHSFRNMDDALTLSDWIARLLDQYPHSSQNFATRVGSWVLMSALFQWQVNPTVETWQKVPEWLRPLPSQTSCPHLAALDFIVWYINHKCPRTVPSDLCDRRPQARERILFSDKGSLPLINSQMLLEWPFPHSNMVTQDDTTGATRISSNFEKWCFELRHWHIHGSVEVDLPELTGLMSLVRSEQIDAQVD